MFDHLLHWLDSNFGSSVIGAVLGVVATWLLMRPTERRVAAQRDRSAAGEFITALAAALIGMAADFRNGRVPHRFGHAFEGAMVSFDSFVSEHLGVETKERLNHLMELARDAQRLDAELYAGVADRGELERWAIEAERAVGDLEAIAAKLKRGKS
jgi:hypothetical protein